MRPERRTAEIRRIERLNRVRKLTPGRARTRELDRIALELEYEADTRERLHGLGILGTWMDLAWSCGCEYLSGPCEAAAGLRLDALFLRRLAWDLGELRDAVRGETAARRASVSKGPRP